MSVNLHIADKSSGTKDMHIICGANEARECWEPIFQQFDLAMLEYAFSAGISLDMENQRQFMAELDTALSEIEKRHQYEDDFINIVYRARRLARLLASHPVDAHDVYVG